MYIGTIDQGTTSTRFIIFSSQGIEVASHQIEHKQYYPKPGWVEHDPLEIWKNTETAISKTLLKSRINPESIKTIGITNQRETVVAWNKKTGIPYYNAIVWQDTRSDELVETLKATVGNDFFIKKSGLPLATYFSSTKINWLIENCPEFANDIKNGDAVVGTIDSWLIYNLNRSKKVITTDITNAGRTQLMNIHSGKWDKDLLKKFGIPEDCLPEIESSIPGSPFTVTDSKGVFGTEIPVYSILGDQQSALFGQKCFEPGESKCTYGTGGFLLQNTGATVIFSNAGLLTTPAWKIGNQATQYALEGSIAVAGSLVQWLRDNMGLISSSPEIEKLAAQVHDNGDVYIVPAFAGLFAPYWNQNARGTICGLTGYANKNHIARAVLEATAYQVKDLIEAIQQDTGKRLSRLQVDGGMTANNLLMQFQADILNIDVIKPDYAESTAKGAAYSAALGAGIYKNLVEIKSLPESEKSWHADMIEDKRNRLYSGWKKAVERSLDWA